MPPSISALAFDLGGQRVVAGYSDKNVRIWDITRAPRETIGGATGIHVWRRWQDAALSSARLAWRGVFLPGHRGLRRPQLTDTACATALPAEWIAWQANDGNVQFRLDTEQDGARYGVVCQQRHAHAGRLAASRDGRWLAAAGPDQYFTVWDAQSGRLMVQPLQRTAGGRHFATAVAFSPDGERLAVATRTAPCGSGTWPAKACCSNSTRFLARRLPLPSAPMAACWRPPAPPPYKSSRLRSSSPEPGRGRDSVNSVASGATAFIAACIQADLRGD